MGLFLGCALAEREGFRSERQSKGRPTATGSFWIDLLDVHLRAGCADSERPQCWQSHPNSKFLFGRKQPESTRRPRKRRLVRVRAHKSPIADLASASSASGHAWIQNPCGPAPLKDRQAVMLPAFLARLAHSALLVPVRHRRSSINLNSEPRSATPGRTSIGSMSDRLRGTQTWAITRRMRCAICWRSEGCVIYGAATC